MKELGTDDKGRKIVLNEGGSVSIVLVTGQRVTYRRKDLVQQVTLSQAEVDKWTRVLTLLDAAIDADAKEKND